MRPDELMARCAASGIDLILTFQQSVPDDQARALQNYAGRVPKQTRAIRRPEWTAEDAAQACYKLDNRLYAAFAFRFAGDESQRGVLRAGLLDLARQRAKRESWKLVRECSSCEGGGIVHEIVRDPSTGKAVGKPGAWETRQRPCGVCIGFTKRPANGQLITRGAGRVVVVEQLVDLAIFEEWLTVHYVTGLLQLAQHKLWAGLIGIAQAEWEHTVHKQYRAVQCAIDDWCGEAYRHAASWMRDEEEPVVA